MTGQQIINIAECLKKLSEATLDSIMITHNDLLRFSDGGGEEEFVKYLKDVLITRYSLRMMDEDMGYRVFKIN